MPENPIEGELIDQSLVIWSCIFDLYSFNKICEFKCCVLANCFDFSQVLIHPHRIYYEFFKWIFDPKFLEILFLLSLDWASTKLMALIRSVLCFLWINLIHSLMTHNQRFCSEPIDFEASQMPLSCPLRMKIYWYMEGLSSHPSIIYAHTLRIVMPASIGARFLIMPSWLVQGQG